MPAEWAVAFVLGLVSSTHCLGMCGGIAGALTYSLNPRLRQQPGRFMVFNLAYNLGRVSSYMAAGAIIAAGTGMLTGLAGAHNRLAMQVIGATFLVAVGLHIGGWFPRFARVESLGRPLWRRLEPLGRRLLPVQRLPQAFGFGLVWGWLPCGLVYSALIYSLSTEQALRGALFMGFFGLGTLPMLLTVGVMASGVAAVLRRPGVRRAAGLCVILLAPLPLLVSYWGHQ
ncbi:MAG: sulfite exporter TauE/SafE family protein [Ectothiorhodospiraceae bacterium]|nr:sulfite exporter TauE/SafE family protein [Ectothiorhodospiraceae bacterium]